MGVPSCRFRNQEETSGVIEIPDQYSPLEVANDETLMRRAIHISPSVLDLTPAASSGANSGKVRRTVQLRRVQGSHPQWDRVRCAPASLCRNDRGSPPSAHHSLRSGGCKSGEMGF